MRSDHDPFSGLIAALPTFPDDPHVIGESTFLRVGRITTMSASRGGPLGKRSASTNVPKPRKPVSNTDTTRNRWHERRAAPIARVDYLGHCVGRSSDCGNGCLRDAIVPSANPRRAKKHAAPGQKWRVLSIQPSVHFIGTRTTGTCVPIVQTALLWIEPNPGRLATHMRSRPKRCPPPVGTRILRISGILAHTRQLTDSVQLGRRTLVWRLK
jgi:hypothetical protein